MWNNFLHNKDLALDYKITIICVAQKISDYTVIMHVYTSAGVPFVSCRKTDASPEPGAVRTASNPLTDSYSEPR